MPLYVSVGLKMSSGAMLIDTLSEWILKIHFGLLSQFRFPILRVMFFL